MQQTIDWTLLISIIVHIHMDIAYLLFLPRMDTSYCATSLTEMHLHPRIHDDIDISIILMVEIN